MSSDQMIDSVHRGFWGDLVFLTAAVGVTVWLALNWEHVPPVTGWLACALALLLAVRVAWDLKHSIEVLWMERGR